MKLWQKAMIGLARSERITGFVQSRETFRGLVHRFVGGESTTEALKAALRLRAEGITSSLFFLGEYVEDPAIIAATIDQLGWIAGQLATADLDIHLSVDPTQLGLLTSPATCTGNVVQLAETVAGVVPGGRARPGRDALMLDMEDRSVTQYTLGLHDQLQDAGLPAAITIQGYLHRTLDDVARLAARGAWVRLVKGAFAEPGQVAVRKRKEIDTRYRQVVAALMSPTALDAGTYNAFGTHDHVIIEEILALADQHGWKRDRFEFEMLYGVRPELQSNLVRRGYRVRLYVPFGHDWFPYAIRRVGESPRNLRFAVGAMAKGTR